MANTGRYPADTTTDVGKIRVLTEDNDPSNIRVDPDNPGLQIADYFWHSDTELQTLIDVLGMSAERVSIRVLRMVAMTPAMQYKKWSSADLSVDGPAITRAIRDLINDIEKGLDGDAAVLAGEFSMIVNTGPAMGQPAFFPRRVPTYNGQPLDPTLPII